MKFNEKLIELRRKAGLSQEELGYKLNVTRQTVSKWELGQTTPEMDKLSEMSRIFNISVDQLINDSEIVSDSNVDPINSKIEDQPIQEKSGKNNKIIFIAIIAVIVVLVLVIVKGITEWFIFKNAANKVLDMGAGIVNSAINGVQNNNPSEVGGEFINGFLNTITGNIDTITNVLDKATEGDNDSNKQDVTNSMQEGMNFISGIIGGDISDQISQTQNQVSVKSFNGPIELYAGTSKKLFATTVLDKIITSNKTNDRKITVKYEKTETQDESKIRSIKQTINKADAFQDFEIICEYDAQGYIYKVIIEKV